MSLRKARLELIAEMQTISEIRFAPDGIPEQAHFPFLVSYADNGVYTMHVTDGQIKGLHNITLDLHVIKEPDITRAYDEMEPFADLIVEHLYRKLKTREWSTINTFGQIDYDIAPAQYGGVKTLSIRFVVRDVKVLTNV